MRPSVFSTLILMVSLSNHELLKKDFALCEAIAALPIVDGQTAKVQLNVAFMGN